VGDEASRKAVAGYFQRRGLPTDPDQIILGPGSKPLALAILAAIGGDVITSRPSWVTYDPQVRLIGRVGIPVNIPAICGGVPDPELLMQALDEARAADLHPTTMILTSPDNPTGTTAPASLVAELARIAAAEDLMVISDEIYSDIMSDVNAAMTSPATFIPERTIITTGLSKSLSLGGWRIGAARFPEGSSGRRLSAEVASIASESWSSLAGPQQAVAEYAFDEPDDLVEYRNRCAALHSRVATAVHGVFTKHGVDCRPPTGGFYIYPDLESSRAILVGRGVNDSASLEQYLLDEFGVAVLGGHHFGDDPTALRFRVATSMLYGDTVDEQQEALDADDPVAVHRIDARLARLDQVMKEITGV
jgi:aspartate aminotransferase